MADGYRFVSITPVDCPVALRMNDLDYTGQPPEERIQEVADALVQSLRDRSGKQPVFSKVWRPGSNAPVVPERRLPTQVHIDNSSSDRFTLIDVFAHDRLGLLYAITRTIFELGLSVHVARIGTHLDQVVDVFYVTDQQGAKLASPRHLEELRARIKGAIDAMGE